MSVQALYRHNVSNVSNVSKHESYDRVFLLYKFKMMTFPDVFSNFLKFWFCGLLGEGGG